MNSFEIDSLPEPVRKLQKQLAETPLIPLSPRKRNRRARIMRQLMEEAKKAHVMDRIDLSVGTVPRPPW